METMVQSQSQTPYMTHILSSISANGPVEDGRGQRTGFGASQSPIYPSPSQIHGGHYPYICQRTGTATLRAELTRLQVLRHRRQTLPTVVIIFQDLPSRTRAYCSLIRSSRSTGLSPTGTPVYKNKPRVPPPDHYNTLKRVLRLSNMHVPAQASTDAPSRRAVALRS